MHVNKRGQKYFPLISDPCRLSHDPDTIHVGKVCVGTQDFHKAMFLTGHAVKARTHARVEITHFLTQCIIRALCFPSPDDAPCGIKCKFHTAMGSCSIPFYTVAQYYNALCSATHFFMKIGGHMERQSMTSSLKANKFQWFLVNLFKWCCSIEYRLAFEVYYI